MESRILPSVLVQYHKDLCTRLKIIRRDQGSGEAFDSEAQSAVHKRVFFQTSKGFLGLGPQLMQAGDVVCMLFRERVPFILRPKDGYYRLVGECYVHGVMDGEVVQRWKDGKLTTQEFDIR